MSLDVIIIGGGPTGLSCAIECQRAGLSYLVLEKGCIAESILNYPTNMVFFTTPELLEIGDLPMISVRDKPNRTEALKYYRRAAEHYKLRVNQYERVDAVEGADDNFTVRSRTRTGQERCHGARKVVLATGYYDQPNRLNVPGEELEKVTHYYREPHPYYDTDVAVIGGKNSAAIAALELYRHGARVTLIHRGAAMSDSVKYWIKPDIDNRIKNGEIRALFNSSVKEIREEAILMQTPGGEEWLKNDFVLALIGYRPDLEFLASVGVQMDWDTGRPCCSTETYETNVGGVYLAGVLVAGMHTNEIFIENGRFHGAVIAKDIAAKLVGRASTPNVT